MKDEKNLLIRNSTAEFLTFELQSQQDSIEVRYEDETIWLTQKMMSMLFDVSVPTFIVGTATSNNMDTIFCVSHIGSIS